MGGGAGRPTTCRGQAPRRRKTARPAFVFFISGDKVRAPDAAMAFRRRVG